MQLTTKYKSFFNQHDAINNLLHSRYNVLLYGCPQSGKKTFIQLFIEKEFMVSAWNKESFPINNERRTVIELRVRKSKHHIEILLVKLGNNEKYIMKVIGNLCAQMILDNDTKLLRKVVVLYNVHYLSIESQNTLKVILERYHSSCVMFLTMRTLNPISEGFVGNIHCYRFSYPSIDAFAEVLKVDRDDCTLRKIYTLTNGMVFDTLYRYRQQTNNIAHSLDDKINELFSNITVYNIKRVREINHELIVNNMDPCEMIKMVLNKALALSVPFDIKRDLTKYATEYQYRLTKCERQMYHMEAFTNYIIMRLYQFDNALKSIEHSNLSHGPLFVKT